MSRLFQSLRNTRARLGSALSKKDAQTAFAELEEGLLLADSGTKATAAIIAKVRKQAGTHFELAEFGDAVRQVINSFIAKLEQPDPPWLTQPHVMLLVGSNGGGKTTTAAKLAHQALKQGKSVVLAAADTFRAAAAAQLQAWADHMAGDIRVVTDSEPGAAAFNAVAAGQQHNTDLVIIDTAGRQATSKTLMAEAQKIHRAVGKSMASAPHETLLILDANTGQNALSQVATFDATLGLSGLVLTKLDSTARGGVLMAIASNHDLPVRLVGIGEGINDCIPFDASLFAAALFVET